MHWAASITPLSTSLREDSTNLATNGAEAITKGTMVAVEPMEVPTINRVTGITATSKIKKGTDLSKLTTIPKTVFIPLTREFWLPSDTTRATPKGNPITYAKAVETRVI